MLPQLSEFLEGSMTAERKSVFLRVMNALNEAGFETHRDEIDSYLGSNAAVTADNVVETLEIVLHTALRTALTEYGIILVADFDLEIAGDLLTATLTLDNYADSPSILTVLSATDTPESIMADLLDLTGRFNAFDYLSNIDHVSSSLIERLELIHAQSDPQDISSEEKIHAVNRVKLLDVNDTYLKTWVDDGLPIGLPIELYLTRLDQIEDEMTPESAAKNVMAIVMASNLTDERLDENAMVIIESHMRNAQRTSEAIGIYRKIKGQLSHA